MKEPLDIETGPIYYVNAAGEDRGKGARQLIGLAVIGVIGYLFYKDYQAKKAAEAEKNKPAEGWTQS